MPPVEEKIEDGRKIDQPGTQESAKTEEPVVDKEQTAMKEKMQQDVYPFPE